MVGDYAEEILSESCYIRLQRKINAIINHVLTEAVTAKIDNTFTEIRQSLPVSIRQKTRQSLCAQTVTCYRAALTHIELFQSLVHDIMDMLSYLTKWCLVLSLGALHVNSTELTNNP